MDIQSDDSNQINISDVIEVIETDEAFGFPQPRRYSSDRGMAGAYLEIIEQPAPKGLRFRYECEGRSAGSLPGINSTPENKTYPTVRIVGYTGKAVIIVSCVTKDPPYKPHPHNLVGRETCKNGVCRMKLLGDTMTATFANLGIQCVKKKDIEEALKVRERLRMDPFATGFSHKNQTSSIDLNSVRLCFQAFLEGNEKDRFTVPLLPVVSEPIYDKKAIADLIICKISHGAASVAGGQEIIILCEKVAKEDISIRFFEEGRDGITWEGYADFIPGDVHKQVAISLRTPRYRSLEIEQPVKVYIQLRRPSDGKTSSAHPFLFTPLDSDGSKKRKRQKYNQNDLILQNMDHIRTETGAMSIKREPLSSPPNNRIVMSPGKVMSPLQARTPSPQYQQSFLVQGASGGSKTYVSMGQSSGGQLLVPFLLDQQQQQQNIPNASEIGRYLFNMDTQQTSVEVNQYETIEHSLSNNLSSTLNLIEQDFQPGASSESLTRLTTNAYNQLTDNFPNFP